MSRIYKTLGTVAMVPKGTYNPDAYYDKLNVVVYNDSTYMAKEPVNGENPATSSKWQLLGGGLTREDIIDNLNSDSAITMLSAKQGKILNGIKPNIYDNVATMKADTNLKNGMTAQTLGYYSVNDGGSATYKIRTATNNDSADEMFIISIGNSLVAELIILNGTVSCKQLGFDNTAEDVSTKLQAVINKCKTNYKLIVDDLYNLTNSITIDNPVNISGKVSIYSTFGTTGFKCYGDETFFYINEGTINSKFEYLHFEGSRTHSEGYQGCAIRFTCRDESLATYRLWKNTFSKCSFFKFDLALDFYATGTLSNYDYASEMLFIDCKFKNNNNVAKFTNKQSHNTNFISSDMESEYSDSNGITLTTNSSINLYGCSIMIQGSFIKTVRNTDLTPNSSYGGGVNITNCRFETYTGTVFNYNLEGGSYPGSSPGENKPKLNVTDCDFLLHNDGNRFLYSNIKGLKATFKGITFTGSEAYKTNIYLTSSDGITQFSRIIIETPEPEKFVIENTTGSYIPWLLINGTIKTCPVSKNQSQNHFEYDNKIHLGYAKTTVAGSFDVFVPWDYKKFVINISGAFIGNTGTITITNSAGTFTETFTKTSNSQSGSTGEILLPYNADGDTYTITSSNIWGHCYFEK